MPFQLLEYFVTRSRVVGVSMEIFEVDDSTKEDSSFLCVAETELSLRKKKKEKRKKNNKFNQISI